MKGLLLKEFLVLKSQGRTYGLLLLIYAAISLAGNYAFFSTVLAVIMMILPMTSFTLDEQARWDKFATALPDGRRKVVQCKYQMLFLLFAAVLVISLVFSLGLPLLGRGPEGGAMELILTGALTCGVGLLINLVLFPFLFKYGSAKSRIALACALGVLFGGIALGAVLLKSSGVEIPPVKDIPPPLVLVGAAAAVLLVGGVVSYGCSMRIYANKEF